ncbi:MAG: M3 family peptidase, partial [Candidatus Latescibacteria bacterium]|nr:M3 family peptidase [Candidatus Latescibacterota bacterium]
MSGVTVNPLLDWTILPPFDQIKIQHFEPAVESLIEQSEKALSEIEAGDPTSWNWDRLMIPIERVDDGFDRVWGVISHLHSVKNSQELRDVYDPLLAKVVAFSNRMGQSKPIYEAYRALREGREWSDYSDARKRIIES